MKSLPECRRLLLDSLSMPPRNSESPCLHLLMLLTAWWPPGALDAGQACSSLPQLSAVDALCTCYLLSVCSMLPTWQQAVVVDELSLLFPAACRGQIYALNMQYSPQGAISNVPANSVLVAFGPSNSTAAPSPGDFKVQLAGTQQAGQVLSIIPYQQPQSYLVQVSIPVQQGLGECLPAHRSV